MDVRYPSCAMNNVKFIPDFLYQDIDSVYGKVFVYLYRVVFQLACLAWVSFVNNHLIFFILLKLDNLSLVKPKTLSGFRIIPILSSCAINM